MSEAAAHTSNGQTDKPVGELIGEMTSQVTTLLRKELDMARLELRGELKEAAKAGGMLSGAALSGYLATLFGSLTVAWFLDRKLPRPLAFGTVAVLHGTAAALLLKAGQEKMKQVDPVPTQTVETLKENVEWARSQSD